MYQGKLARNPFIARKQLSKNVLDIVYMDLCGPMRSKSLGGALYFMVFIDDHTRWTEVRFLKHKSDTLNAFISIKNLMEKQSGHKLKSIHTDNGAEFCSNDCNKYLKQEGIVRRLTVPHSPQQNGASE